MAWVYIKQDDKKDTFLVATEAYESVFKKQGFKIIGNAENDGSTAQAKADCKCTASRRKARKTAIQQA